MQKVPVMQNAEFHLPLNLLPPRITIRYTLVNKEYSHEEIIILIELVDEQDFLYVVPKH